MDPADPLLIDELSLRKRIADLQEYRRNGVTSIAEGERYDHAKTQRVSHPPGLEEIRSIATNEKLACHQVSAKQASYRDSVMLSYDRAAARQNRAPTSTSDRKATIPRPSTSSLTLANSSSLHLLTVLEQQLCSTLRILPRPYLFLKESLMREWVRTGGNMGLKEAKKVVGKDRGEKDVGGEWGEKVERVFEFLLETGGLRKKSDIDDPVEQFGEGVSLATLQPVTNGVNGQDTAGVDVEMERSPEGVSVPTSLQPSAVVAIPTTTAVPMIS